MKFLTVEFLLQFIALFIGILSAFIRFNNKTEKKHFVNCAVRERCSGY